jgi:hypothetical protein
MKPSTPAAALWMRLCVAMVLPAALFQSASVSRAGPPDASGPAEKTADSPMVFEEKWKCPEARSGVAADPLTGDVYVLTNEASFPDHAECLLARLDRGGKKLSEFKITTRNEGLIHSLRLANLVGDREPEFVTFERWQAPARAYDRSGKLLWEHPEGNGVDDVWVENLAGKDGDGHDQVIIGYNGGTGIHVLNANGTLRWKDTRGGNVWHVVAGPTGPEGAQEVIASASGNLARVFDKDGKHARDINLGDEAWMVRVARGVPGSEPLLVSTSAQTKRVTGTTLEDKRAWQSSFPPGRSDVYDAMAAVDRPWIAIAMGGERVLVYDTSSGKLLTSVAVPGGFTHLAWLPASGNEPPLLIVVTTAGLSAGILRERDPKPAVASDPTTVHAPK